MSFSGTTDIAQLPNADLCAVLAHLDAEERDVATRRHDLHRRIDDLRSRNLDSAQLDALELEERELSRERHELHRAIAELRLEQERRVASLRSAASLAAV
jgi:hypothetical protein